LNDVNGVLEEQDEDQEEDEEREYSGDNKE
jgi:hypothetical protein